MKTEIKNREDIIKLVDAFYTKVKTDTVIGYLFNDVAAKDVRLLGKYIVLHPKLQRKPDDYTP